MPNLIYSQSTGIIRQEDGSFVASGWAGNGHGKNRHAAQSEKCVGPLPVGVYRVGPWHDHPRLGPMVALLVQIEGETYGRSEFYIHGPSKSPSRYGQESMGCIVIPRTGRTAVHDLEPQTIEVVP